MRQPDSLRFFQGLIPFPKKTCMFDDFPRISLQLCIDPMSNDCFWKKWYVNVRSIITIISHLNPSSRKTPVHFHQVHSLTCCRLDFAFSDSFCYPFLNAESLRPWGSHPFSPTGCNPETWKNVNALLFQLLPSNGMWDQRRHRPCKCIIGFGLGDTKCLHLGTWSQRVAFQKQHVYNMPAFKTYILDPIESPDI